MLVQSLYQDHRSCSLGWIPPGTVPSTGSSHGFPECSVQGRGLTALTWILDHHLKFLLSVCVEEGGEARGAA